MVEHVMHHRWQMEETGAAEPFAAIRGSLEEISNNIAFMRRELASLPVADEVRVSVRAVCDALDSTLYDVGKEVSELNDALASEDGNDEARTDPARSASLIRTWLRQDLEKL